MKRDDICKACYWYEICSYDPPCDDFTPIGNELSDEEIDDLIEMRRLEYRAEWAEYLSEFE